VQFFHGSFKTSLLLCCCFVITVTAAAVTAILLLSVNLMGLLKWRDNPRGLETYLRLFMKVDGEEIVKVGDGVLYNFNECVSTA